MAAEPQAPNVGRGLRDQIARYRTAFIAIVVMIVLAVASGGYILAHERLTLPSWVPIVGSSSFPIKAEFETGLALSPGQGQPVTISGVKVGEISSVELRRGIALVGMNIEPRYAHYIYRNATMLVRPKTQLKDETIEVEPGTESAGRIREGEVFQLAQTAPEVNLEEFLNSFDGDTRTDLRELLASAGTALNGNGKQLSAVYRRFYPLTLAIQQITGELAKRQTYIKHSIHNFQLLISALGGKEQQLREVIEASDKDFGAFAKEDEAVESALKQLPSALHKTGKGLGKLSSAAKVLTPTLQELHPFAASLKPAQEQSRKLFKKTTPVIANEIEPFAREILPVLEKVGPATEDFDKALPELTSSFAVLNEFFNELAYNPGSKQAGFLFFLEWANHDFNSALSSADADGSLGRTQIFFNCELAGILKGVAEVNPNVKLIVNLLRPPEGKECEENKIPFAGSAEG
jgi:phospholipid/cholesterol/gamma-HCH transport system substrate-binding protein